MRCRYFSGYYIYLLVVRHENVVRIICKDNAKIMISAQKMQESHIFFVSLHPNLGNLNKYVGLPQAFRKDFAP